MVLPRRPSRCGDERTIIADPAGGTECAGARAVTPRRCSIFPRLSGAAAPFASSAASPRSLCRAQLCLYYSADIVPGGAQGLQGTLGMPLPGQFWHTEHRNLAQGNSAGLCCCCRL